MFNDIIEFKEDIKKILLELIIKELEESIEYCLLTHNLKPIIEIRDILKYSRF